ncbi:uncharacterized protein LOC116847549 [Odontomachus brunneus]|uniref:uncharacterized protein LOC116847549 n=1 Tax=Odontomachus brunneus TaxID=486640 RepID=UPI0013F1D23D|nr:uncharacterized protein LOC116847549 [Odontomachus brunneus]
MEVEQNNRFSFLDVLVTRRTDGSLGHQVYRKPTHINRYLHAKSHQRPAQKQSVLDSLIYRALAICDKNRIQRNLKDLRNTLQNNGYTTKERNSITTFLRYIQGITDKIGRILKKHNIKTIYKPPTKIGQYLNNPKDRRPPLDTSGVYRVLCSCGKIYIRETGRMVSTRMKEHQSAVKLKNVTQSALTELNLESGHKILFNEILAKINNYFPRKYRESLEIQKHPNNLNRDNEQKISPIWQSVLPVSKT